MSPFFEFHFVAAFIGQGIFNAKFSIPGFAYDRCTAAKALRPPPRTARPHYFAGPDGNYLALLRVSFAESGIMIPSFAVSLLSFLRTRTRSCSGGTFTAI
jgi:hypothetical protein